MSVLKKRVWLFEQYLEHVPDPDSWLNALESTGVRVAVGPVHDRDLNDDGSVKKPHVHGIVSYDGPVPLSTVVNDLGAFAANSHFEPCRNYSRACRYLTHFGFKDKFHYAADAEQARELCFCFNGFDLQLDPPLSPSDKLRIKREISEFIFENSFSEYCELVRYALQERPDWFEVVSGQTVYFRGLLSSCRHSYVMSCRSKSSEGV